MIIFKFEKKVLSVTFNLRIIRSYSMSATGGSAFAQIKRERRLRIRRRKEVSEGKALMNPKTMSELGISSEIEVVIAGKKHYFFQVSARDEVPPGEVWCNDEQLKTLGIADNTIATVRAKRV